MALDTSISNTTNLNQRATEIRVILLILKAKVAAAPVSAMSSVKRQFRLLSLRRTQRPFDTALCSFPAASLTAPLLFFTPSKINDKGIRRLGNFLGESGCRVVGVFFRRMPFDSSVGNLVRKDSNTV